jgi:hypothetical protein
VALEAAQIEINSGENGEPTKICSVDMCDYDDEIIHGELIAHM